MFRPVHASWHAAALAACGWLAAAAIAQQPGDTPPGDNPFPRRPVPWQPAQAVQPVQAVRPAPLPGTFIAPGTPALLLPRPAEVPALPVVQNGQPAAPQPKDAAPTDKAPAEKNDADKKYGDKKKDDKDKPPPTWHGHKFPVQPFPPPGDAPVAPTAPGYYSFADHAHDNYQESPPRWPYPRFSLKPFPFAEVDFRYVDSIPFEDRDWAERLKRIPVHDHQLFSTGGDLRTRYNHESNSRLSGTDNTYQLFRARAFADLWFEDLFRLYAEVYYADSVWQDLPPLARDVNRGEFGQLFVDIKVCQFGCDGNPVYVRAGRQELIYGSQRLISPNEWGDNRTRFQGVKGFYRSARHDFDVFVTNPVQVRFGDIDPPDQHQTFSGAWYTYKPKKGTWVDLYYLNLENNNATAVRGQTRQGGFNISTFGGRYFGRAENGVLWDFEGAVQTGRAADQSIYAQMFSANVGWYFKDCPWTPTFWVSYDYASGDPDPNATGTRKTFNQLFAFGHYYFGFTDLVARQNIRDVHVEAYAYPTKWVTTGLQYHVFRLDSDKDALYNAFGQATRRDATGRSGGDVGSEIDLLVNFHLTDRQDVFLSYSRFFAGSFIQATQPTGTTKRDVDAFYLQYTLRY